MIYLGGVEAEHAGQAEAGRAHAVFGHAEGMRRVIDHRNAMLAADFVQLLHIAQATVHMHRQDRAGFIGDEAFDLICVDGEIILADISKHRREPLAHDGMRGGGKRKRRGDDLALKLQCAQQRLQRQMAVGEQFHLPSLQKIAKLTLKSLHLAAVIGEPTAVPQIADFLAILLKRGHGALRHIDAHDFRILPAPFGASFIIPRTAKSRKH